MENYDLVILGGGTSGCACAYNAGKLGLKTLLVEKKIHLGGSISSSLVMPAMKTSDKQINIDFFNALVFELKKINCQIEYMGNKGWFNTELIKIALDRLMKNSNTDVLFNSDLTNVELENNIIKKIYINGEPIKSKYYVDATGNCILAQKAGCEFLPDKYQPVSLRFQMSGIDLDKFSNWLLNFDSDRNVSTVEKINGNIHLSTAYTSNGKWALAPLFEDAVLKGILKDTDCNYFQIFTVPGMPQTINFNCPRVFANPEINPLNIKQISQALIGARESILRLADFCKNYLKGFENAYISNIADDIGIRVSKRIKGKYIYTSKDLREGKKFKNPVLIGNYPIDIHSNKKEDEKLEHVTQDYELPIESLMSYNFENLFVIGRSVSADFEAQAALRIQPACFSMGEGAAKFIYKKICELKNFEKIKV